MDSLADFERECFFIAPLGEEGGVCRSSKATTVTSSGIARCFSRSNGLDSESWLRCPTVC